MSGENLEELKAPSEKAVEATISIQTEASKVNQEEADADAQEPVSTIVVDTEASNIANPTLNSINMGESTFSKSMTPTTKANLEPSATVKFVLAPMNQVVTLACPLRMTIKELKLQFSSELKVDEEYLEFTHSTEKKVLQDDSIQLGDLGVEPNGIIQLRISSKDQVQHPINRYESKENFLSPDVITVHCPINEGEYKELIVEIERSNLKKKFLGGFKNKLNGKEFLNASSQTNRPPRESVNNVKKFCRDTQTVVTKHTKLQTRQDMSTQMTKPGVFVSVTKDKLTIPRPYKTAAQCEADILKSVIIIQKYFRRWLASRRFREIKLCYEERINWEKMKERERMLDIEQRRQNDINRRLNPKTKDDFEILYSALEKWRYEELSKINGTKTGAARKAALAMLVDQEAELIGTIERYKIEASKENREKQIQALLEKMSKPKSWKYKDGTTTELDSPYSIRARELKDIYNSLNMNYLTQDERLDVLLTLKHTVKEHDCKLTQEIINLIDREADLLMRGIKEENILGLRKRIASLFLQYIKSPQFNPAAAKHLKVPQDVLNAKLDQIYCKTCERYLPSIEFQVSSSSAKVGKCRGCKNLENLAIKRVDYTKFKFMLQRIQKDEQRYGQDSRICFLLTDRDIQYMFESIWTGQSILSACTDIYQLHFVRWNKEEEWTPWNTLLLTLDEAESHLKLKNLELSYGDAFTKRVKQRHVMARNYFSRLPSISDYLSKTETLREELNLPRLAGIKIQ